ncbi:S8 family serine peptidase [Thermomonospora cellulosilytica]|uniref:Subtilisin family serine protease n=1 Tax=Thermomonospora cellulosilytica TaxID=1411118 RepID=A0A7W3MWG7_9ACTN|nr:S8 family serine peptidase [Thermomonospora cellulosilytica]MBA9003177.1 subtilisin family serine protease [Thermomonospora cellulosilytica]
MAATAPQPLPQQWWFGTWAVHNELWAHSKGQGVTVAVLDTGVEADLPELSGAVLAGANFESGGGDGRTDTDPHETNGHGTGISVLIASRGGNSGFLGIAPEARILPIVTQSARAYAKGLRFAADRGAKVINMSQGLPGPCPAELQEAVRYAIERDAVIVTAAGNDGLEGNPSLHPANCKGVLSVGAADVNARPWEKTERQPYVDIAGPGVAASTVVRNGTLQQGISGTSISAALTSGVVALVRSKYPQMRNREVVQKLVASAKDIGPTGRDDMTGYGFIRPYRIFEGKLPQNTGNPVFEEYDAWAKANPAKDRPGGDAAPSPQSSSGIGQTLSDLSGVLAFAGGGLVLLVAVLFARSRQRRTAMATGAGGLPGAPHGGMPPAMMPGAGIPPAPGQMPGPPPAMGAPGPMVPPQGGGLPPQGAPQYQPPQQAPGYGPPQGYGPPPAMGGGYVPPQQRGDAPHQPGEYQQQPPPQH